ncbi:hypothetical protein ACIBSV_37215 [Embleya sp. NPDC050154]|uniref:hypothetical protein n=1 Tax=Embleya sp. NPDC050154 TaxID=3363988 RepID=UPI0037938797
MKVLLTPMGNKIKYQIVGTVHCVRPGQGELPNTRTYDRDDLVWLSVFGSAKAVADFLRRGKRTAMVTSLCDLGYSWCDRLMPRKG